jgi:hypothetical protein
MKIEYCGKGFREDGSISDTICAGTLRTALQWAKSTQGIHSAILVCKHVKGQEIVLSAYGHVGVLLAAEKASCGHL